MNYRKLYEKKMANVWTHYRRDGVLTDEDKKVMSSMNETLKYLKVTDRAHFSNHASIFTALYMNDRTDVTTQEGKSKRFGISVSSLSRYCDYYVTLFNIYYSDFSASEDGLKK